MIIKIIIVFPCGNKIIRERSEGLPNYIHGVKLNQSRPYLIQVFTKDFDEQDKQEIYKGFKRSLHPILGQITINGEHAVA